MWKLVCVLGCVLCAGVVRAHDFWLEADRFAAPTHQEVSVQLYQGQRLKGETLPYITDWFTAFDQIDAAGRQSVKSQMGDDPAARIKFSDKGLAMVIYRSTRDFVELGPAKFASYLEDEGLDQILQLRRDRGQDSAPAREYYSRCAKLLVTIGDGSGGVSPAWDSGMTLELMPDQDPYTLRSGGQLDVTLRYLDSALPDATVIAFRREAPDAIIRVKTDAQGKVRIPLDGPGVWLVKSVHMIPAPRELDAQWESFWASLVFRLPE